MKNFKLLFSRKTNNAYPDVEQQFQEDKARALLENGYDDAEKLLNDQDKIEKFLQRLEQKMKAVPIAGGKLSKIPIMASLIRSFIKKEYVEVPLGSIIAVVSALLYFVSPIDVIPDVIPGVGLVDDAAVVAICLALVESDVNEYDKWRNKNGKIIA